MTEFEENKVDIISTVKKEIAMSDSNKTNYNVGAKVRKTIKKLGGTMPEDLPTPKKSLKELEKEKIKQLKDKI